MVRARQPKGFIAAHALIADEHVLQGLVQGVAHMELAGDVGRGDDDGIGRFIRIGRSVKIAGLFPAVVERLLHGAVVVGLGHVLHGEYLLQDVIKMLGDKKPPIHQRTSGLAVPPLLAQKNAPAFLRRNGAASDRTTGFIRSARERPSAPACQSPCSQRGFSLGEATARTPLRPCLYNLILVAKAWPCQCVFSRARGGFPL